jgi:hypothetical protein
MDVGEAYLDAILAELKQGHRQWKRGDNLLGAFGYTRRRQTAIDLIKGLLEEKGMRTDPTLTTAMPLDRAITFYLKGTKPEPAAQTPGEVQEDTPVEVVELAVEDEARSQAGQPVTVTIPQEAPAAEPGGPVDRGLIIGNLACAERVPEQIAPTASVEEALTRMAMRDYSQLAVTTGPRDIKGVISYKSVAQAYLHGKPKVVNDCLDESAPIVDLSEPLLRVVERFQDYSAVLIRKPDKTLAGIVTPADIAAEFGAMAAPFLLIGQIEEQLRWLIQKSLPDLTAALAVVGTTFEGGPPSVSDLTMGELHRILDHDQNWTKVGIKFDRAEFCKELNAVREIRNAVMHFRDLPDGGADRLKRFAAVVQTAYLALAK